MRALRITKINIDGKQDAKYSYNLATNYTNLATIAYELGDYSKAEKLFEKALHYSKESNNAEKLRDYYYHKSKFEKKRNNLQKTVENKKTISN